MIIENKGEFDVSELTEHKEHIKIIEFKNISEILNLKLLSDFKLLTELKFSTCFVENNRLDLSGTSINTLTISNCYFNINDIIMPSSLKHLIIRSTTITDFKVYDKLKNIIKLEYDLCDFIISPSNSDVKNLKVIEMISLTNCKGLSDIDAYLQMNIPVKLYLRNTDTKTNIRSINDCIDLEIESYEKIKIKNNSLIITSHCNL
jgi:hypothetical protein